MFSQLIAYMEKHGNCDVPAAWSENPPLARWVAKQRQRRGIPADHRARLEALGFNWNAVEAIWEKRFAELKRYKHEHADCNVPQKWVGNRKLASWIVTQRKLYDTGKLSRVRKERLEKLAFDWRPRANSWSVMLGELKRYRDAHGDCNVPAVWSENPELGAWVRVQRMRQQDGIMNPEQKAILDSARFDWHPLQTYWDAMFKELKRYKERYGHCKVPRRWPHNPRLAEWVSGQRTRRTQVSLSSAQKEQLNELGFDWYPQDAAWEMMFSELKRYKKEHGDCHVPDKWPLNRRLGSWVGTQRAFHKNGRLAAERKARLDALGFRWKRQDD